MVVIKEGFWYFFSMFLQLVTLVLGAYFFCIQIVGWIKRKEKPAKSYRPTKKFAMIAAAHNEETVIGELVDSLAKMNYPRELYDIFVIADNCTDRTAEIAEKAGAIVYKRFDEEHKTKGYALQWFVEQKIKEEIGRAHV